MGLSRQGRLSVIDAHRFPKNCSSELFSFERGLYRHNRQLSLFKSGGRLALFLDEMAIWITRAGKIAAGDPGAFLQEIGATDVLE
jgi:hypothetical protein